MTNQNIQIDVEFDSTDEAQSDLWYNDAAANLARQITEWPQYVGATFELRNLVTKDRVYLHNSLEDGEYALRLVEQDGTFVRDPRREIELRQSELGREWSRVYDAETGEGLGSILVYFNEDMELEFQSIPLDLRKVGFSTTLEEAKSYFEEETE